MEVIKILSIIIPVYNVEKYLPQCMESIIHNTFQDIIEIILINDGSTDNSAMLCKEYANKYKNVIYLSQSNKGLSEARNTGIRNAQGKYLMFLDSDDFLYKNILNRLIQDIQYADYDMFLGRALKYSNNKKPLELSQVDYNFPEGISPDKAFQHLTSINRFWFAAWLIIIKRSFLIENSLFFKKGILHEDELWVPAVFIKASGMKFLNYGFYCYRVNRNGSIVSGVNIQRDFDKIIVADELNKYYGKNKISDKILNDRRAAIEFGLIKSLTTHKNNKQYKILKTKIESHVPMLKIGKYRLIYWISKLLGVELTSKILSLR